MNILPGNERTHALVYFANKGSSAVVPSSRSTGDDTFLKEGQTVQVAWNMGKKYKPEIVMLDNQCNTQFECIIIIIICNIHLIANRK